MNKGNTERVSLRTIAAALQISVMTVSRALRAGRNVRPQMRDKVLRMAEQLGYCPDARMLELMAHIRSDKRRGFTGTLAFLRGCAGAGLPAQDMTTNREHLHGAKQRAEEMGYRLLVQDIPFDGAHDERIHRILRARGVTGVILYPPEGLGLDLKFDCSGYSAVVLGTTIARPILHRVTGNERSAVQVCLREAARRGYHRIGLVMHQRADINTDHEFLPAFLTYQFFLPPADLIPVCIYRDWSESSQPNIVAWYNKYCPDLIISTDCDTLRWLRTHGVQVPDRCGFMYLAINNDDRKLGYAGTTQNAEAVGALVVDKVIAQIQRNEQGMPALPVDSFVEASWVEGTTVRALQT
jgi:DNA-binding LacI/PurR family transcriptional regulator